MKSHLHLHIDTMKDELDQIEATADVEGAGDVAERDDQVKELCLHLWRHHLHG